LAFFRHLSTPLLLTHFLFILAPLPFHTPSPSPLTLRYPSLPSLPTRHLPSPHPPSSSTEPNARIPRPLRIRYQLALVPTHVRHPIPQQNRRLQSQAAQGAAREVLPRVHGRGRHQQGRKVHPLEVYADEQGEAERIPAFDAGDGYEQCTSFLSPFPFRKRARSRGKGCSRVAHSSSRRAPSFQIRLVFAAVKETILQNALRDSFV
jgi:hypothetical protein